MKVLVIGQGGREHAIIRSLKKSPQVEEVYCAPGNGGIAQDAICIPIIESDFARLTELVKQKKIELTVVGPENPLQAGIVDYFHQHNLAIIGPNRQAAQLEGSKAFAKKLMNKYNIPTGDYRVFTAKDEAIAYVQEKGAPIVVKADGLAAGKGVVVAKELEEAITAISAIMEDKIFGEAGSQVVIEEYLEGEELTVMAFVDGTTILPMEPAQDHKPVYDGDQGPNTGGMGAYSPVPQMDGELLAEVSSKILEPTVAAMSKEGTPFKGILYAGLMITKDGPKVIEFNTRFGDPETQVILPRLQTYLIDIFLAMENNQLQDITLEWDSQAAVCVIMASEGYPGDYSKDVPISINELSAEIELSVAGATKVNNQLVTSGGRVLGVTALAPSIQEAQTKAYQGIKEISFAGAHYRTDIAQKAIN